MLSLLEMSLTPQRIGCMQLALFILSYPNTRPQVIGLGAIVFNTNFSFFLILNRNKHGALEPKELGSELAIP